MQVESASSQQQLPAAPARAVSRTYPAVPQPQQDDEGIMLRDFRHSRDGNATSTPMPSGSSPSVPNIPSGEERDLEMMTGPEPGPGPGTPVDEPADAFGVLPSLFDPPMNKYRLAACCTMNLLGGLTDSAPGALIPYMET